MAKTNWEALARDHGWVVVDRDPNPMPGQPEEPVLYHRELDRVFPVGAWREACEDIGLGSGDDD